MLDYKTIHDATMFTFPQVRALLSLLAECTALNAYTNPVVQPVSAAAPLSTPPPQLCQQITSRVQGYTVN